ncbi:hypothetical protein CWI42_010970 [Ordospora colligata]|uniref:Uncharacterized protein n=1 Tax=Ordospora colligata OC4 TaxID=1354746 RepID=A0A0B2UME2_9MICR|nr:uncharacterized protein M896_010970 [Ordospora colligata OC4]KHN70444.1 hypothetical protein M896_010970 [Ordospora colligata OC4]TBU17194.1 hypothetical protein CWI41_010970 [Ordospora colligata]TBU17444.1 hypothetical protein CWI40_010970 [Ordospora colligata]TBU19624.1 hypothetical protein CWI42_010970 [Ordospora colligata]
MIGWLGLVIVIEWCMGAIPDIMSGQMYLPPLMGDTGMFGSPQMGGGKAGQVLTFGPDPSSGLMSPMAFQPPGNIQYASTCDSLTNQNEQFKRCVTNQIKDVKAVVDNCKKVLGEDAKECCVDDSCLDVINRNLDGCCSSRDSKACRDEKCHKTIADSIVNNMNTEQLKKSLSDVLKSSLKKIGNGLLELTSCTRDKCGRDAYDDRSIGPSTRSNYEDADEYNRVSSGNITDNVPSKGVMLVPVEKKKYDQMFGMLDEDVKRMSSSNKSNQRHVSDPNRTEYSMRDSDYTRRDTQSRNAQDCLSGNRSKECVRMNDEWQESSDDNKFMSDSDDDMNYTNTTRSRKHRGNENIQRHQDPVNKSTPRTTQSHRTDMPRKAAPAPSECTRKMCSQESRNDVNLECTDYCKRTGRSSNATYTNEGRSRSIEDTDALASDSCLD